MSLLDKLHRNDNAKDHRPEAEVDNFTRGPKDQDPVDAYDDQHAATNLTNVALRGAPPSAADRAEVMQDFREVNGDAGRGAPPSAADRAEVMQDFREVNGDAGRGKPPSAADRAEVMQDFREVNGDAGRGKPPSAADRAAVMQDFREVNGDVGRGAPPSAADRAEVMQDFREVNGDAAPPADKGRLTNVDPIQLLRHEAALPAANPMGRLAQVALDDAEAATDVKQAKKKQAEGERDAERDAKQVDKNPAKTDNEKQEAKDKADAKKEETNDKAANEEHDDDKKDDATGADKKTSRLVANAKAVAVEKPDEKYGKRLELKHQQLIDGHATGVEVPDKKNPLKGRKLVDGHATGLAIDGKPGKHTTPDGDGMGVDVPGKRGKKIAPDGHGMGVDIGPDGKTDGEHVDGHGMGVLIDPDPSKGDGFADDQSDEAPLRDSEGNAVPYKAGKSAPAPQPSKGAQPGGFAGPKPKPELPKIAPQTPTQEAMQSYIDKARQDREAARGSVKAQKLAKSQQVNIDAKGIKAQVQAKNNGKLAALRAKAEKDKAEAAKKAAEQPAHEGPVTLESLKQKLETETAADKERLKQSFDTKKAELKIRMQTQRETLQAETKKQIDNWKKQEDAKKKQLDAAFEANKKQWEQTAKNLDEEMKKQVAKDKERLDKEKKTLEQKTQERMNELDARAKKTADDTIRKGNSDARDVQRRAKGLADDARNKAASKAAGTEDEDRKDSIIAEGERRARGLEVTGKNDAKKVRDEAKKTADDLIEKGKQARQAAHKVALNQVKAIDDKIGQLKGLADERVKKARADLDAKIKEGEDKLKATKAESQAKIDKLKQEGDEKIAKLEGDAEKKLQQDYDREVTAIDKKVEAARKSLAAGNEKNIKALQRMVDQTCKSIDQKVTAAEKRFDNVVQDAEKQAMAFVLAQLQKIKAEADKALREIDKVYDEAMAALEEMVEQVHHDIEEMSKGKMLEVEVHTATLLADLGDKSRLEACRKTVEAHVQAGRMPQGYGAQAAPEPKKDKDGKPIKEEPKKDEGQQAIDELKKLEPTKKEGEGDDKAAKDGEGKDAKAGDQKAEETKSPAELQAELDKKVDAAIKQAQTQTGVAAAEGAMHQINENNTKAEAHMKAFVQAKVTEQDAIFSGDKDALKRADKAVKAKEDGEKAAKELNDAMDGVGTDEKKIFASLKDKSPEEIAAIKEAYKLKTGRDLEADLLDELSDEDLKEARALLSADPVRARVAAVQNALAGWNDPAKVKDALYGGDPPLTTEQRKELVKQYKLDTGRDLNEVLAEEGMADEGIKPDEFKPEAPPPIPAEELAKARADKNTGVSVDKLINATCGDKLGTDEAAVVKALEGKSPAQIAAIKEEFLKKTGRTLDAVLVDEMEGAELKEAMATMSGDPVQIAVAKLDNAAHGGVMPGTDLGKINETLEGIKDPETRKKVKEEYEKQTGQKLDEMLDDELSGFDRDLAKAYAGGNPEEVAAVKADKAMHGGFLTDIADGIADTVGDATGVTPEERQKLRESMREGVGTYVVGAVAGPFAPIVWGMQAAGVNVFSTDMGTDEKALYAALESCPDEYSRQKLREEYKKRTGKELDADVKGELSGAEGDVATYLLEGDQMGAEAAKMKAAGQGVGTDKQMIYDALSKCKTKEERDKLIKKYNELYGGDGEDFNAMLKNELAPSASSTLGWSAIGFALGGPGGAALMASGQNDLDYQKALLLVESKDGKLPDGFALYYGMNEGLFGLGTDDDALKKIIKGPPQKTKTEIEQLKKDYAAAAKQYGKKDNADLFNDLMDETSGRTGHELKVGMMGKPETPEELKKIEQMNVDFERNESSWVGEVGCMVLLGPVGYGMMKAANIKPHQLSNGLIDSWSSSGENLDQAHADFQAKYDKLNADPKYAARLSMAPGSEERIALEKEMMAELEGALARSEGNLEDFQKAKDATADVAGTAVALAVGATLTIVSGGALGPAAIALISGMSGLGATMAIKGGAMSNEEIGQQLVQVLAETAAAGLVDLDAVKALVKSASTAASAGNALAQKLLEEMIEEAIESGAEELLNSLIDPANFKGDPSQMLANIAARTGKSMAIGAMSAGVSVGTTDWWDPQKMSGKMAKGAVSQMIGSAASSAIDPSTYEGSQDEKWGKFARSQVESGLRGAKDSLGGGGGHPDYDTKTDTKTDTTTDSSSDSSTETTSEANDQGPITPMPIINVGGDTDAKQDTKQETDDGPITPMPIIPIGPDSGNKTLPGLGATTEADAEGQQIVPKPIIPIGPANENKSEVESSTKGDPATDLDAKSASDAKSESDTKSTSDAKSDAKDGGSLPTDVGPFAITQPPKQRPSDPNVVAKSAEGQASARFIGGDVIVKFSDGLSPESRVAFLESVLATNGMGPRDIEAAKAQVLAGDSQLRFERDLSETSTMSREQLDAALAKAQENSATKARLEDAVKNGNQQAFDGKCAVDSIALQKKLAEQGIYVPVMNNAEGDHRFLVAPGSPSTIIDPTAGQFFTGEAVTLPNGKSQYEPFSGTYADLHTRVMDALAHTPVLVRGVDPATIPADPGERAKFAQEFIQKSWGLDPSSDGSIKLGKGVEPYAQAEVKPVSKPAETSVDQSAQKLPAVPATDQDATADSKTTIDPKTNADPKSNADPKADIDPKVAAEQEAKRAREERIRQQQEEKGHAGIEVHSHFLGNVDPKTFRKVIAESGLAPMKQADPNGETASDKVGDTTSWEPVLREIIALGKQKGFGHTYETDADGKQVIDETTGLPKIKTRGVTGDAIVVAKEAQKRIEALKEKLLDPELPAKDRQKIKDAIYREARSAAEKALRASDETDFNSSYEVRDELIKKFYGDSARKAVLEQAGLGPNTPFAQAAPAYRKHFADAGRPDVVTKVDQATKAQQTLDADDKAKAAGEKGLSPDDRKKLQAQVDSVIQQFAYDRFAKDTVLRLIQDGLTYTEQSNSSKKLAERFDPEQIAHVKQLLIDEHPELKDKIEAFQVKHLTMLNTASFGTRDVDGVDTGDIADQGKGTRAKAKTDEDKAKEQAAFNSEVRKVVEQTKRGDVVGVDIAGAEHFTFDQVGKQRFAHLYDALYNAAIERGQSIVLRPHVGEGANDMVAGKHGARDMDRQMVDGELSHYARAKENLDALISVLEEVAKAKGKDGKLPPEVIVRFGHATHATPQQAARMAKLGVIAEVNLSSNVETGSASQQKPKSDAEDNQRGKDEQFPKKDTSQNRGGKLEDHSLANLILNDVPIILSTDGHSVMSTTMKREYDLANKQIDKILRGKQRIPLTLEQAQALGIDPKKLQPDADGTVHVKITEMPASDGRAAIIQKFEDARRKFFEAANDYYDSRPRQDDQSFSDGPGDSGGRGGKDPGGPTKVEQKNIKAPKDLAEVDDRQNLDAATSIMTDTFADETADVKLVGPPKGKRVLAQSPADALIGLPLDTIPAGVSFETALAKFQEDGIPRWGELTENERMHETAFANRMERELPTQVDKFFGMSQSVDDKQTFQFEVDKAKQLYARYGLGGKLDGLTPDQAQTRATANHALHPTAVALARLAFLKRLDEMAELPKDHPYRNVFVTNGGCGAGKGSLFGLAGESMPGKKFGAVWDAAGEGDASENGWILEAAAKRGIKVTYGFAENDAASNYKGVLDRAEATGRIVDPVTYQRSYVRGQEAMKQFLSSQQYLDALAAGQVEAIGLNIPELRAEQARHKEALKTNPNDQLNKNAGKMGEDGYIDAGDIKTEAEDPKLNEVAVTEAAAKIFREWVDKKRVEYKDDPQKLQQLEWFVEGGATNTLKFVQAPTVHADPEVIQRRLDADLDQGELGRANSSEHTQSQKIERPTKANRQGVPEHVPVDRDELRALIAKAFPEVVAKYGHNLDQKTKVDPEHDPYKPLLDELRAMAPGELATDRDKARAIMKKFTALSKKLSNEEKAKNGTNTREQEGNDLRDMYTNFEELYMKPMLKELQDNKTVPPEIVASLAHMMREEAKVFTRDLMSSESAAETLYLRDRAVYGYRRGPAFDEYLRELARQTGSEEKALAELVKKATESNADANEAFKSKKQ